jgi:hypothetical protein
MWATQVVNNPESAPVIRRLEYMCIDHEDGDFRMRGVEERFVKLPIDANF